MGPWQIIAVVSPVALVVALAACSDERQTSIFSDQFQICSRSDTWVRPSVEEQRREVWSGPRHRGTDERRLTEILNQPVFPWSGGNSELFDSWPLHGLWTASDSRVEQDCAHPGRGKYIDLYLLNHRALSVTLEESRDTVLVEPSERGYQHIQFWNRLYQEDGPRVDFRVVVQTRAGEELLAYDTFTPRYK